MIQLLPQRVWRTYLGGARIDRLCCAETCEDGHFPEDWIASCVRAFNPGRNCPDEGLCKTTDGAFLKDLLESDPAGMLGEACVQKHGVQMPILVKLLDAAERLVIQAHPTVAFAKEAFHSEFGKTELWYILEAEPDACVYLGFAPGITRADWEDCFWRQDIPGMLARLNRLPVKRGDCIFVDGGVPHAIGGGCLMAELQEPTDLMVIPERVTPAGIRLSDEKLTGGLGFSKMFDCFTYEGYSLEETVRRYFVPRKEIFSGCAVIVDEDTTDKFKMWELSGANASIPLDGHFAVAVVTKGKGTISDNLSSLPAKQGDRFFIPAAAGVLHCMGNGDFTVLVFSN